MKNINRVNNYLIILAISKKVILMRINMKKINNKELISMDRNLFKLINM